MLYGVLNTWVYFRLIFWRFKFWYFILLMLVVIGALDWVWTKVLCWVFNILTHINTLYISTSIRTNVAFLSDKNLFLYAWNRFDSCVRSHTLLRLIYMRCGKKQIQNFVSMFDLYTLESEMLSFTLNLWCAVGTWTLIEELRVQDLKCCTQEGDRS